MTIFTYKICSWYIKIATLNLCIDGLYSIILYAKTQRGRYTLKNSRKPERICYV
jgi:hypothetical protein